jgi:hypothetical protein
MIQPVQPECSIISASGMWILAKVKYLCSKCDYLFECPRSVFDGAEVVQCSQCHAGVPKKLSVWPTANENSGGPPAWEFICQVCGACFETPVPRGPDEAEKIRCPACGNAGSKRYNALNIECYAHAHG